MCIRDSQNVVNAMINEIASDRVVYAGGECDLELRPHSISRSDQHRLLQRRKRAVKHSAKTSDLGKRAFVERAARKLFNPISGASGGININTRIAIRN